MRAPGTLFFRKESAAEGCAAIPRGAFAVAQEDKGFSESRSLQDIAKIDTFIFVEKLQLLL